MTLLLLVGDERGKLSVEVSWLTDNFTQALPLIRERHTVQELGLGLLESDKVLAVSISSR